MATQHHPVSVAPLPQPSPAAFFQAMNGYQQTAALKAAVELEVFTAVGEGQHTAEGIARRCQASERGTRMLCDYLVTTGFLEKRDGRYLLTRDSGLFLDRQSPQYLGGAVEFLTSPLLREGFDRLAESVRAGGSVLAHGAGSLLAENPVWVQFARSMAPMMRMMAEVVAEIIGAKAAEPCKVLDIAAGHGMYGITVARLNPQAEVYGLDWSNVLEVARENAQKAGVAARYHTLAGNAMEVDFGRGYDLVLLPNFLHHFDVPTNEKLLRKVHAALTPGGRAVVFDFVPNDDRVTPPEAAGFTLTMLATTPHGDVYTYAEYDRMLRAAGFASSSLHPMPRPDHSVIMAVK